MTSRLTVKQIEILLGREKPKTPHAKPKPPKSLKFSEAEEIRRTKREKRRMK